MRWREAGPACRGRPPQAVFVRRPVEIGRQGWVAAVGEHAGDPWTDATIAFASVVRKPNSSCLPSTGALFGPRKPRLGRIGEIALGLDPQRRLVLLHRQEIVGARRDDRLSDRGIAGDGVDGDERAVKLQFIEQLGG